LSQEILCVWRFDLMALDGEDLRPLSRPARKQTLKAHLRRSDHLYLRYSEPLIWVQLPDDCDAFSLFEQAASMEIGIAPGPIFSASRAL
jgi:ATP-dependent DNA ligase